MLLIRCPYCEEERPELEFRNAGEAHIARAADIAAISDEDFEKFFFIRSNPKGIDLRALAAHPWLRALLQRGARHGHRQVRHDLQGRRAEARICPKIARDSGPAGLGQPPAGPARTNPKRSAGQDVDGCAVQRGLGSFGGRRMTAPFRIAGAGRLTPAQDRALHLRRQDLCRPRRATRWPRRCLPTACISSAARSNITARAASCRPAPRSRTRWSASSATRRARRRMSAPPCRSSMTG